MNKRVSLAEQKEQARRAGDRIIKMEQMGKRVLTLMEAIKKINVLMDDPVSYTHLTLPTKA